MNMSSNFPDILRREARVMFFSVCHNSSYPRAPLEIVRYRSRYHDLALTPPPSYCVHAPPHRDFWWNSVGFVFLTCYHFWWLAPVNLYTGVNVATMSVPPDSLEMFGKYYRPLWGVTCGVLQVRLYVL